MIYYDILWDIMMCHADLYSYHMILYGYIKILSIQSSLTNLTSSDLIFATLCHKVHLCDASSLPGTTALKMEDVKDVFNMA